MGSKIFAIFALVGILAFVGVNTYTVGRLVDEIIDCVCEADSYEDAMEAERYFSECERYISITVSHEDLTNIEDLFSQYVAESYEGSSCASITKSRLINALSHLGRLSDINIDSVI